MARFFQQKKTRLIAAALIVAGAAGFGALSYASPWRALERLESAASRGDAAELSELVDFEAVRVNLARDLTDKTVESLGMDPYSDAAQTAFQTFLAVANTIVTPQAMGKATEELKKSAAKPSGESKAKAGSERWSWEGRYASLGRFEVDIRPPGSAAGSAPKIRVEFARQGPMSWRADRLALPKEKLALPMSALTAPGPSSPASAPPPAR